MGLYCKLLGDVARQCCGTVIHNFGGAEDPRALQPCDKHCTTTPGSETCSVLLHVAVL